MADELSETAGGATKGLLSAAGFILLLLGGEILLEKASERPTLGIVLAIAGIAVFFVGVGWKWLQPWISRDTAKKLNWISADPVWLVAIFSVFTTFSLNQLGLAWTLLSLAPLGIGYAIFAWRRAGKVGTSHDAAIQENATSTDTVEATVVMPPRNPQVDQDILHLLDFGVYQTTLVMLSELIERTPSIYNVDPNASLPFELANDKARNDADIYLQLVRRRICDGSDRAARYQGLWNHAETWADRDLKSTPQEKRPPGDPLELRDYAISFRRAVLTASFLRGEKSSIEEAVVSQRSTLIERYRARSK